MNASESITSLDDLSQEQPVSPTESAIHGSTTARVAKAEGIDDIKKELLDPRTISRKHNQEGRNTMAKTLYDTRQQKSQNVMAIGENEEKQERLTEQVTAKVETERQLEETIADRMSSVVVRIKAALKLPDKQVVGLQGELSTTQDEKANLLREMFQIEEAVEALKKEQEGLPSTRTLVEAYYSKMETEPMTNEEKRRLLTPEVLANLSMEEYTALWRRLNPYFLSHVTRQGFRDHNAMIYHSAGLQEFHNGFVGIIEDDGLLRPPFAIQGLKGRDKESVEKWMEDWVLQAEDADSAKKRLDSSLHFSLGSAPTYPDKTAVHFAAQVVANSYYGGETYNEAFFIYPSDALASQYDFAFNGWEKDFTQPQSEMKWNDVFIWPPSLENPGIPIDAGVVFLPNSTLVDRNTGSKYASEVVTDVGKEKRVMVEDTALVEAFVRWGAVLNDRGSTIWKAFEEHQHAPYLQKEGLERDLLQGISNELTSLGFTEDAAWALSAATQGKMYWTKEFNAEQLQNIIRESGANWARAKDTITAKDYWESFFASNPQIKPKHIVYYEGSPTAAVFEFQQKNGIGAADTSVKEGVLLGFDDKHLRLNEQMGVGNAALNQDNRAMKGHDELVALATDIITERYKIKE